MAQLPKYNYSYLLHDGHTAYSNGTEWKIQDFYFPLVLLSFLLALFVGWLACRCVDYARRQCLLEPRCYRDYYGFCDD